MLAHYSLHICLGRESSFARRFQSPIDAEQLIWRRVIYAATQTGIDFERNLRKLSLRLLRPSLDSLQHVFEDFRRHSHSMPRMEMAIK
jgi:hypothetical protein